MSSASARGEAPAPTAAPIKAMADLAVGVGANVAPGQIVIVNGRLGQEELVRAVAAACYRAGAHHVDVQYGDPYVQRARWELAPEDALGSVPPWVRRRPIELGELKGAMISLAGPPRPGLFDDLDPGRIGRDMVSVPEWAKVIDEASVNWTIVPAPTVGWAQLVFPDHDPERALAELWERVVEVCRLSEPDPLRAWWARSDELRSVARRLDEARLDELHLQGPGIDLRVGLIPGVRWMGGGQRTFWGRDHLPNIPTEEVFTSPDPVRTEGHVTATRPLLVSGREIKGLRMRFEGGRAVEVDAEEGGELMREVVARDEHACFLGEVALVDASSRVGRSGTVFHDTLLDENAASHIAVGSGFAHLAREKAAAERINVSGVHTDFMIGSEEVRVTGRGQDGRELDVLVGGRWAL